MNIQMSRALAQGDNTPVVLNGVNEQMLFEGMQVEIIEINSEPYFEIYSTGMALGHVKWNGRRTSCTPAKDRIDKNIKNAEITTVVRNGQRYINEEQLYDLMLEMKTDKVKPFRKWVTSEVLPSIRKTGNYSMQEEGINRIIKTQNLLTKRFNEFSETLTEKINKLEAQAEFNHRPSHATKLNWNKVIKAYSKCSADEDNIKHIVFARFTISKWEDLTSDKFSEVFGYIREIAEKANLIDQVTLFDKDNEKGEENGQKD